MTVTDVNNNQTADTYRYDANGNMTCRIESGETFLQTYNIENQMSGIALASGDCDTPGTLLKTWIYTYDGDGCGLCTPERHDLCVPEHFV
jgi:YD repeat-containing protein